MNIALSSEGMKTCDVCARPIVGLETWLRSERLANPLYVHSDCASAESDTARAARMTKHQEAAKAVL